MKKTLTLFITTIFIIILFFIFSANIHITSDHTSIYPLSLDLLKGNIWLKDWILGTNNFYFTEIIPYAFTTMLAIPFSLALRIVTSSVWPIIALFTYYFFDLSKLFDRKFAYFSFFFILIIMILSPITAPTLLAPNSHNNLYLLFLLQLHIIKHYLNTGKLHWLIYSSLLGAALQFSEGFSTMVIVAPLALFSLISIFIKKEKKYIYLFLSVM